MEKIVVTITALHTPRWCLSAIALGGGGELVDTSKKTTISNIIRTFALEHLIVTSPLR